MDAGELPGTPSTVVDLRAFEDTGEWSVLRAGAVPAEIVANSGTNVISTTHTEVELTFVAPPAAVGTVANMTELQPNYFERPLAEVDPEVAEAIDLELDRQRRTLEMIASENLRAPGHPRVPGQRPYEQVRGGYPGKRYYGGCEHVDVRETRDRPREESSARPRERAAARRRAGQHGRLLAALQPGDTIMGLDLAHGGHLSHGMRMNFSGKPFKIVPYGVRTDDYLIDFDEGRESRASTNRSW